MTSTTTVHRWLVAVVLVYSGLAVPAAVCWGQAPSVGAGEETEKVIDPLLMDIHQRTGEVSVVVFPVDAPGVDVVPIVIDMANGVALVLERAGFKDVQVKDEPFRPTLRDGADIAELAEEFSRYIGENSIETDYAYFTQFIGTQQTGPQAVSTVVVDSEGAIVWSDAQMPEDESFMRYRPNSPLGCAFVSVEGFRDAADLLDIASPDAPQGKWYSFFKDRWKARHESQLADFIAESLENIEHVDEVPSARAEVSAGPAAVETTSRGDSDAVTVVPEDEPSSSTDSEAESTSPAWRIYAPAAAIAIVVLLIFLVVKLRKRGTGAM